MRYADDSDIKPLLNSIFGGQIACGQRLMFQHKRDQIIPPILRNTVPDRLWPRRAIREGIKATFDLSIILPVKCGARDAQHIKGLRGWQMRPLNCANDLQLLGCCILHSSNSPAPVMLFKQAVFQGEVSHTFFQSHGLGSQIFHLMRGRLTCCVAGKTTLSSLKEFLRSSVIQSVRDTLAATKRRDSFFATKTRQNNADLLLR